jgi:RimJ/RimL family protein N-acetyltransferase
MDVDPTEWERHVQLHDGRAVHVRAIRPGDAALYGAFLGAVSPEDARMRFLVPMKELSESLIHYFTQIDYARAMAFIALDETSGEMLAVVRLHNNTDNTGGEYAIIVRSDVKGHGLGRRLMELIIAYGRARGLHTIEAKVLQENATMLHMCSRLGFTTTTDPSDARVCNVRLEL